MFPVILLLGRIAGQHNSVKLQYSLTFNFLCMFSHARRVRAHPKEAAFLLSKNMFMQTRCRNSPGIQGCKSYFTSLSGRERYGSPPLRKNTGVAHKGIYVHSQNIVLMFIFGCVKLTAICGPAPVSLRHTHPCFICQLWQIRWLLRSSLAPENGGFEPVGDVLVFSTPSHLSGWITVKSQSSLLSTLVNSQVASDTGRI